MLPKIFLDQLEIFNAFEGTYMKLGYTFQDLRERKKDLNFIDKTPQFSMLL